MDTNLQNAVDAIGKADVSIGQLEGELTTAAADIHTLQGRLTASEAEVIRLQAIIDASDPGSDPIPDPPVDPPPTALRPLIGNSWGSWPSDKTQLEAQGGKLEAARIYYGAMTDDPTANVRTCFAQHVVPALSFKPTMTWKQIGDGSADAQLQVLASRLKTALAGTSAYVTIHHEPDKQGDAKTIGEGGPASEFGRMWERVLTVMRPITGTKIQYGPILNGWWFSSQARKFSAADIEVWLPKATRDRLDFIGADDYNEAGGEKAITRAKNRVAMLKTLGFKGYTVTGETNTPASAPNASDLRDLFNYAKSEPMFAGGYVCLWNGTIGDYKPVQSTGMLTTMQEIIKGWHS